MSDAILVLDDSLTVRMELCDALTAAGMRPIPCTTCEEARVALATERPNAAILDVNLPDGNGVDLLYEIRRKPETKDMVVLLLSTEAELRHRSLGIESGANEYVGKPYDTSYIVTRMRELRGRGPDAERRTILVIDDSATYREAVREALEGSGENVIMAESGEEGLRVLASREVDAAIVDGVLPGMDGPSVIRRIRLDPALRGLPCLLLTADDHADAELRALDAGADVFVRKTEDVAVILARLAAMLRKGRDSTRQAPKAHRVLVVDDDAASLEDTASELRAEGWDIVGAKNGDEALDLLALQRMDCILMGLPFATAEALCARIKAAPIVRDIPLILMGAEGENAMVASVGAGADDHLQKPCDSSVLKARVRAQLRRKEFADEHLRSEREAQEARASRELAETRGRLIAQLEQKSAELEAFSYSVSHDLRAPLRAIGGFSQVLAEDHSASWTPDAQDLLMRVRTAAARMDELIADMLQLARVGNAELEVGRVDLSAMAHAVLRDLRSRDEARQIDVEVSEGLYAQGDSRLVRIALENLLGNAWKFTAKSNKPKISVGAMEHHSERIFVIKDNGAGFDMAYAHKLFRPFQRLHGAAEFPGTGVGLATVQRVIERHGGRVWAEANEGRGAAFFFTLPGRGRT